MGTVFSIQKFCTDDGPGIRTTVFLKGCHLHCRWCHNPEGLSRRPLLLFDATRCVLCRRCEALCPNAVHSFGEAHGIDRSRCTLCGACVKGCVYGALRFCGEEMTPAQVLEQVLVDRDFYGEEGGLTVSGGEPLLQPEFVRELGELAKGEGLHVCLETSGAVPWPVLEQVAPVVDLFLFDVKDTDPQRHMANVGVPLDLPRENLRRLDEMGKKTLLRCPIIPGINDREAHFAALGQLRRSLRNCVGIQLMPYHDLGRGKEGRFGTVTEAFRVPDEDEKETWQQMLERHL